MQCKNLKFTSVLFILGAALMLLMFSCKTEAAIAQHTVTIDLNGGGGINDLAPKVNDGDTLTLTNPTKDNAVFKGWSTTNDISNLDFISGSTKVTADIKIYAMYNTAFTVTIDPNGGTLSQNKTSYQVEKGASLAKLDEIPQASQSYQTGIKEYRNTTDSSVFTFGTSTISGPTTLKTIWNVDLKKVRDILSGGSAASASGYTWKAGNLSYTFQFISSNTDSLDLNLAATNLLQLYTDHTTNIQAADDYNSIAKFNITNNSGSTTGYYSILSLTSTSMQCRSNTIAEILTFTKQ